mmetsp:Transcript_21775/g.72134  ORF Transcript_21775/g.72134 Transcript_21775/m.72134 type:complete len:342 (+) Transcript_21775:1229-2254(+)
MPTSSKESSASSAPYASLTVRSIAAAPPYSSSAAAASAAARSLTKEERPPPGPPSPPPPPPCCRRGRRRRRACTSSGGKWSLHLCSRMSAAVCRRGTSRLSQAASVCTKAGTREAAWSRSCAVSESIFFGCQPSLSGWSTRSPSRALTSQSLRRNSTSIAASLEARDGWEAKAEQTPLSSVRKRRAASDERASWRKPLAVRRHCSRRASRACLSFPLSAAHAASFSLSAAEAGGGAGSDAALSPRRTEAGISSCLVCTSASRPSASASRKTASLTSVSANSPNAAPPSPPPPGSSEAAAAACSALHGCGCCHSARSTLMMRKRSPFLSETAAAFVCSPSST